MKILIENDFLNNNRLITIKMEHDETGMIITNNKFELNKAIISAKNIEWVLIDDVLHIHADKWQIEVLKSKFQSLRR